ncbi:MAG: 3-dehydroquinate synthase II [Thermoplasmata archaeon]|nr:3-dehydroquinate synthase II [Thermoplasmata archaeon]
MIAERVLLRLSGGRLTPDLLESARRLGLRRWVLTEAQITGGVVPDEAWTDDGEFVTGVGGSELRLRRMRVGNPSDLEAAIARTGRGESVLVHFDGDRVIPLESLLSVTPATVHVWVELSNPRELSAALGALERGAQGAVIAVRSPEEIQELAQWLEPALRPPVAWRPLRVSCVRPVGTSERVLVDTTSLLTESEGLLVGSVAAWPVLLLSEAQGSSVSRPRPFRVNAGAPHSYTVLAGGETRYLSELAAGDSVLVAARTGATRSVRVGRLKIERRPMTMVELESPQGPVTVFVQEAETVRFAGESAALPVTELVVGDLLLATSMPGSRHLGRHVEETVLER